MFFYRVLIVSLILAISFLTPVHAVDVPIPAHKPDFNNSSSFASRVRNFFTFESVTPTPDAKPLQQEIAALPRPLKKPKPKKSLLPVKEIAALYYEGHVSAAYKAAGYRVHKTKGKEAQVAWLAGLSAWRLGKFKDAAAYFERAAVAQRASHHLVSAAAYWAGRANMRSGHIHNVSYWYGLARKQPETFYGLLATRALGVHYNVPIQSISESRYLNSETLSMRPELIKAIVKQESKFNPHATNPSGATGLMQLLPSTASYVTGDQSLKSADGRKKLQDPIYNLKVGQKYLKYLLKSRNVKGNLLYLLIAYNAGPGNLAKWRSKLKNTDDGLLFIESIPSSETRAYIERVLTTYWLEMLHHQKFSNSLDALAAGKDPIYPEDI